MYFMVRLTQDPADLHRLLLPETPLESALISHPAVWRGLLWGEPRFGHPEGKVGYHVREVLDNINLIPHLSLPDRRVLRLVALLHDAFKYIEDRNSPRDWERHHSILARRFTEQYTSERAVLDLIAMHDDAYYIWLAERKGSWLSMQGKTLDTLLLELGDLRQLYYLFFKCDTQTGDKMQGSLRWFEARVPGIVWTPVRERELGLGF